MASENKRKLPQVGRCLDSKSHPSSLETESLESQGCPLGSGEGHSRQLHGDAGKKEEVVEDARGAFQSSSLTARSPPVNQPQEGPTSEDLERLQLEVAMGEISLNISSAPASEQESVLDVEMKDERLPSKVRRRMMRDKKMADGTWLPVAEWRKSQGLKPRPQYWKSIRTVRASQQETGLSGDDSAEKQPSRVRRSELRDRKVAEGTWVPEAQWRKDKGWEPRRHPYKRRPEPRGDGVRHAGGDRAHGEGASPPGG